MPTVEQHITQYRHNRRFAESIDSQFRDWQVTAIFYAALHAVDAALTKLGIPVSNHEDRNNAVRNNAALTPIREKYLNLYRISKVTRYDAEPDLWLPHEYLQVSQLADDLLKPIEFEVEKLIGKDLKVKSLKLEQ
jgi:hypothetical protein